MISDVCFFIGLKISDFANVQMSINLIIKDLCIKNLFSLYHFAK